jgi:hypothetical protein
LIVQTAFDLPDEELEERDQLFLSQISQHGFYSTSVTADEDRPRFTYSTGFWLNAGHPEVIIFSLPSGVAHDLLWDIFRMAQSGLSLPVGIPFDSLANLHTCTFPVSEGARKEFLCWADWFYCRSVFPCLQLVWPDQAGVFPWENGFSDRFANSQPDISANGWSRHLG